MASMLDPRYTVKVVSGGRIYMLDNAMMNCSVAQPDKQIAQKCQVDLVNLMVGSKYLSDIIKVNCKAYVYYNVGSGPKEKMRGLVWTVKISESDENVLQILIYDYAIYLQKSKASWYLGGQTKSIFKKMCKKWGIGLSYNYKSIKHDKRAIRSKCLSDTFLDFLDEVKKQTGKKYEIYFKGNTLHVTGTGTNATIYNIKKKENAVKVEMETTMDEVVTQVVIQGPASKSGKPKIVKTVKKNVKIYGRLQDEISKDKKTSKKKATKEANYILKEKSKPKKTGTITCIDIPMVKRGDRIYLKTDTFHGYQIITDIEHNADKQEMDIETCSATGITGPSAKKSSKKTSKKKNSNKGKGVKYKVKSGDTVPGILRKFLGRYPTTADFSKFKRNNAATLNKWSGGNIDKIYPGEVFVLYR